MRKWPQGLTASVNPIYYVTFTTSTIFASVLLFQGFNTEGAAPAISLLGGFITTFLGVFLLNLNRAHEEQRHGSQHSQTADDLGREPFLESGERDAEELRDSFELRSDGEQRPFALFDAQQPDGGEEQDAYHLAHFRDAAPK